MRTSLSHLPKHKQDELNIIRDIILEKIPDVRMIILFGSYARGNWVEDSQIESGATHIYESDFDILVAVKRRKDAEDHNAHDRVEKAIHAANINTPYGIIYHCFSYIQEMLKEGHYFFTDIQKEGIYLYRTQKHHIDDVKTVPPKERKKLAQEHFDQWFENAEEFLIDFDNAFERESFKKAAFYLHQTTECLYSAVTLVFVNYRFRTHDIDKLGRKAVSYDEKFASVFPRDTEDGRKAFNLLRKAYIDARYKDSYEISKQQLQYLSDRVKVLTDLTNSICEEKIESFI